MVAILTAKPEDYTCWSFLIRDVPFEAQVQHPDLLLRVLKRYDDSGLAWDVCLFFTAEDDFLAPDLWRNREVVLALFRCGLLFWHGRVAPEASLVHFNSDREFWLQAPPSRFCRVFRKFCPSRLISDHNIMLRAVQANPHVCLSYVTGDPLQDFDLILAACATSLEFAETVVPRVESDCGLDDNFYPELKLHIRREVRDRSSRYLSFTYFVSLQPLGRSPLGLLNQGPDTSQGYRSLLASYAGVPSDLEQLASERSGLKRLSVALARRGL